MTTTKTAPQSLQDTRLKAPLVGGLLAFALALGICAGLVAWGHAIFPTYDDGVRERFRQVLPVPAGAAAAAFTFQRVPITIEREELSAVPGARAQEKFSYRLVASPLGGLLLVGLALVAGGAVANRLGQRERSAVRTGFGVAAVFAGACFVLSFFVPLAEALNQGPDSGRGFTITYRPSPIGALIWPFIWGLIFGSLGAFIGKHGRGWRRELVSAIEARTTVGAIALRAAATGVKTGLAMFMLAALLTAGFGIALHTEGAGDVLGSAETVSGIAEGVVVGLPHTAGIGLVGSMGIPARYEIADRQGAQQLGVGILGGKGQRGLVPGATLGGRVGNDIPVPGYAFGGLLIAIAFTVATGYRAASLSGEETGTLRPVVAAAACLTIFLWIIALLIGIRVDFKAVEPCCSSGSATLAPGQMAVILATPLWTLVGGFVGARLHARRRAPAAL